MKRGRRKMPPKSPKGQAAVEATAEEEEPQEIPWPPIDYVEKRRADAENWLLESVQVMIYSMYTSFLVKLFHRNTLLASIFHFNLSFRSFNVPPRTSILIVAVLFLVCFLD